MKKKKICFKYNGKKICLDVLECNFFEMGRGLMFRRRENSKALLFKRIRNGSMALTGVFVFFSFIVLWVDKDNNVLEIKKVSPFSFHVDSKTKFEKIIEIPMNSKYSREINLLVDK